MPVKISKVGGGYQVRTPNQVHAKHTTLAKAKAQERLLNAIEHNPGWRPTGKKSNLARGYSKPKMKSYQQGGVVTTTGPAFLHEGEVVTPASRSMQETMGQSIVRQAQKNEAAGKGYAVPTYPGAGRIRGGPQIDPGVMDRVLREKGK